MARRNRKKNTEGYIVPVPFAVLIVMAAVLSLGYLWLEIRCESLGKELKTLETDNKGLREKRAYEEARWSNMRSPRELKRALKAHRLAMMWPGSDRIIRISARDITVAVSEAQSRFSAGAGARRIAMND